METTNLSTNQHQSIQLKVQNIPMESYPLCYRLDYYGARIEDCGTCSLHRKELFHELVIQSYGIATNIRMAIYLIIFE